MNLNELTIHKLNGLLSSKKISAQALVKDTFSVIENIDNKIHAFVSLCKERALKEAVLIDKMRVGGERLPPLAGIPVAVKDNICVKGLPTTCSSGALSSFQPPYEATVIEKLRSRKAVIIGKTNMDEFAMGSSTENSSLCPTCNPWDTSRVPGGSSGGSAAAVAGGEAIFALGSDTGGSIRQPASLCGVVGLKPTYGRISRYGLVAFASSLDQIGPITKDVRDAALVMNCIAGRDTYDSTSCPVDVPDYTDALDNGIKGLKIGIPSEYFADGMDKEVESSVLEGVKLLEKSGAHIEKVSLPHTEYTIPAYYIIATAEASSNLARYDGVQYGHRSSPAEGLIDMYKRSRMEGLGKEVKRRIMLGTYVLSTGFYDAYYIRAQKVRTLIKNDFDNVFKSIDCIVTPTSPTTAFKIGEKTQDPLQMYLCDIFTCSANLAGIPGLSLPCGFSSDNLPIGIQLLGRPFEEALLLRIACAIEQNSGWHRKRPQMA